MESSLKNIFSWPTEWICLKKNATLLLLYDRLNNNYNNNSDSNDNNK